MPGLIREYLFSIQVRPMMPVTISENHSALETKERRSISAGTV